MAELILIMVARFIDTNSVKFDKNPQLDAPNCTKRTLDLLRKHRDIFLESLFTFSLFSVGILYVP